MAILLRPSKMSWVLILAFLVLSFGMGIAGFIYYGHEKEDFKEQRKNELLAIATLKVRQIEKWREERQRDAEMIFNRRFIAHQVEKHLENPKGSETNEGILSFMASLQMYGGYESVFLLDAMGRLKASVPTWRKPGGPSVQSLIARAIHERKIVFSDLYRDEAQDRILIDLIIPVLLQKDRGNRLVGIMLLRTEPHDFLYPLIQTWPLSSSTAESLLVRREGDEIVFLNELRHQKNTALILRLPMSRQDLPSSIGFRGQQGVVEAVDYRGVKVLAAIQRIPDSPWILIAKIDQQEIYLPIRGHKLMLMIVGGLLILATGLIVALIWRQQGAVFREKQYKAELDRQALTKHYAYLAKYANDIIILYDSELRIVEANDRAVSSYGYTRDELLQLNAWDVRPPEAKPILETTLKQAKDQKSLVFETVHQRKDRSTFPVEISVRVIEVEEKEFHQSIIRDITERKRGEEEIRRTQTFLNAVIENIPDMILIKDARDLRFLACNRACEELTGYLRGERIGKSVHDLFPKEQADIFEAQDRKVIESKMSFEIPEEFLQTRHLGVRVLRTKKIPIFDQEGNPQYLLIISADITEKRQAEEALRKSEERFRDLYDNAPIGYHEYDTEGRITNVNQTDLDMLGYTREEMLGRFVWEFNVEEELARTQVLAKLAGTRPPAHELERTYLKKDGTTLPVLIEDRFTRSSKGEITGIRVTIQDITERKRAEEEREKLIHELQEALTKVKTLSGLLPICASCKKVRDDKGYWNQIESYIGDRSEAEFSHGICPECMKKLYPNFCEDEEGKGDEVRRP